LGRLDYESAITCKNVYFTQGIPVAVLKISCCQSAGLVMLSTENRAKTIDGTFFCPEYAAVKHKESTNGYLGMQSHEQ